MTRTSTLRAARRGRRASAALVTALLCSACDDRKATRAFDAGTEPSPNASILPAPLASGVEAPSPDKSDTDAIGRRDAGRTPADAGLEAPAPEPRALREDQALSGETPHESSGLSLTARLKWSDPPPPPRVPELNSEGVQRARDALGFDVAVDLAGGHLRLLLASRAFTLPTGTELHARDDLYGHVLLWPNRTLYTVLAPGALRSVLSQQRADVVPLVRARLVTRPGGLLFSFATERTELNTPTGKLEIEQARAPIPLAPGASWASGVALCRLLIELVGAAPSSTACRNDLVPLRAVYTWPNGEHFSFEVSRLSRRSDLDPGSLAMPPAGAEFRTSELPAPTAPALLTDSELADFRTRAAPRNEHAEPGAPKAGLSVVNHGESLRYLTIDGATAARLSPGTEQLWVGLRPGKYQISARDFFGSEDSFSKLLEVPAHLVLGEDTEKGH